MYIDGADEFPHNSVCLQHSKAALVRVQRGLAEAVDDGVIPPFLTGIDHRIYAAAFSFWAGDIPPMPRCPAMFCLQTMKGMFGRSLL
jgi:hypothetical protein